jgi:hypothetical protein
VREVAKGGAPLMRGPTRHVKAQMNGHVGERGREL